MSKQRTIIVAIAVLLIATVGVLLWKSNRVEKTESIKVGALLGLSGPGANYGQNVRNAINLALEDIAAEDVNGKKIEVIFEDSKLDPKVGVTAFQKLVTQDKVPVSLTMVSGVVLAIAPIAEKEKSISLNIGAQNPDIRKAGEFTFSTINDANVEAYQLADYVIDTLHINEMVILYASASYGVGARNAMKARFTERGGKVLEEISFDEGATDFKTQLQKIKNSNAKAVYMPGVIKEMSLILRQATELNVKTQWLSYTAFEGNEIIQSAGASAEGVIFSSSSIDNTKEFIKKFTDSYQKKYGSSPEIYAANSYDAIRILNLAVKNGKATDAQSIANYLLSMPPYEGVSGTIKFDKDGMVTKPVIIKTVKNGQFIKL
jgi:branched-chain amino acid transport system substrate-binding protein